MKKNFIFEELVDPSSLTTTLSRLDTSSIKNIKTDDGLLKDIQSAAEERKMMVTISTSTGNSVGITKFSDGKNNNMLVSNLSDDVNPESDYSRVKYFTNLLKNKGFIINWDNGKMTITKTDDKVTKPEIEKVNNRPTDFSNAQSILTSVLSPSVSALNLLKNKKSTKNESMVKEEINRIKQLMK